MIAQKSIAVEPIMIGPGVPRAFLLPHVVKQWWFKGNYKLKGADI